MVLLRLERLRVPPGRSQEIEQGSAKRDEAIEIEERQQIEVLGGDALVADRGRLQQHDARHRDNDSHGLALTIEVAREQRRQPDEREGKGVPWTRETLVRLDEKPRGVEAVVRVAQVG